MTVLLLLLVGLACADPDQPVITPPPSAELHPAEVSVEVTEPGEADVIADSELVEPVIIERRDPTPFQRVVTGFVWFVGLFVSAPYEDEALVLLLAGALAEVRLFIDRRRRKRGELDSMLSASRPTTLGAVAERKMRELVEERVSELSNLQKTEIHILRGALADYLSAEQVDDLIALQVQTPSHGRQP